MSKNSYKKVALHNAYLSGVRRCPCCNVQLVWKPTIHTQQKNLATVDHIIPRVQGGPDIVDNIFVMCRKCNEDKDSECFVEYCKKRKVDEDHVLQVYQKALESVYRYALGNFHTRKECNFKYRYAKLAKITAAKFKKHFSADLHEMMIKEFLEYKER